MGNQLTKTVDSILDIFDEKHDTNQQSSNNIILAESDSNSDSDSDSDSNINEKYIKNFNKDTTVNFNNDCRGIEPYKPWNNNNEPCYTSDNNDTMYSPQLEETNCRTRGSNHEQHGSAHNKLKTDNM